jgi:hypothetical protein
VPAPYDGVARRTPVAQLVCEACAQLVELAVSALLAAEIDEDPIGATPNA